MSGFQVATDVLRKEVTQWTHDGSELNQLVGRVQSQRYAGGDGGPLDEVFVPAYHALVEFVAARCREGGAEMGEISQVLGQIANAYDEYESRHVHVLRRAAALLER
jgi:hypothetical protein